jgi:hypothetical protein
LRTLQTLPFARLRDTNQPAGFWHKPSRQNLGLRPKRARAVVPSAQRMGCTEFPGQNGNLPPAPFAPLLEQTLSTPITSSLYSIFKY